jgi:hypothetical protein
MQPGNIETTVRAGDQNEGYTGGQDNDMADVASKMPGKGDYVVGYRRPPVDTRWKPGQSGNPKGRAKGRLNARTILDRVLNQVVPVRQGDKSVRMPLLQAMIYRHASQGEAGDARSASLILGALQRTGAWDEPQAEGSNEISKYGYQNGNVLGAPANMTSVSDVALENVDADLLSREEMTELSRLIELMDLGGDVTALSVTDFGLFKNIVNKGRGKDITPQ